ncbi:MAG TPA: hypothetical protein VF331_11475 [Polyangiales bacterium]
MQQKLSLRHANPGWTADQFPDPANREAGLRDFFARNLRTHLPYRCTHAWFEGRDVCDTVTLRPPGGVHVST